MPKKPASGFPVIKVSVRGASRLKSGHVWVYRSDVLDAGGVPPGSFVILGAGVLGRAAARAALGLGAQVTLLDDSVVHLRAATAELGAA